MAGIPDLRWACPFSVLGDAQVLWASFVFTTKNCTIMKKTIFYSLSMAAIAAAAAGCGKDEVVVDYNDNTTRVYTLVVKNQRSQAPIAGAVLKASNGAASAASGADGVVTLSVRANDNLVYTLEAPNFPAKVLTTNSLTGGSYVLNELGAKSSGILLYTDASGNTHPAPAGTVLKVNLSGYVQNLYEATVTADGAYEFTLPENVSGTIVSPVEIGGVKYGVSGSVNAGTILQPSVSSEPITAWYISPAQSPFALVEYPARVADNQPIVLKWSKDVDWEYRGNTIYLYSDNILRSSYTPNGFTIDKSGKTLTLTPTTTWSDAGINTFYGYNDSYIYSTERNANGDRQNWNGPIEVQVITQ
jgi:hypothetical protein